MLARGRHGGYGPQVRYRRARSIVFRRAAAWGAQWGRRLIGRVEQRRLRFEHAFGGPSRPRRRHPPSAMHRSPHPVDPSPAVMSLSSAVASNLRVGYVMTHYPRPTQSFVLTEVATMRARGVHVSTFALNRPDSKELSTPALLHEADTTSFLKEGVPRSVVGPVARAIRAVGPVGVLKAMVAAARTGGTDPKAVVWRVFQFLEALRVWDQCRTDDVRHLHAHFSLAPATVAWFAAEFGNRHERGAWTWGFTIHGFHDFVNERETMLAEKVASAQYVVCISDFTHAQAMRIVRPHDWPKVKLVNCGLNLDEFKVREQASDDGPIVMVARLSSEKGHLVLLQALAALRDRGVNTTARIVGDGPFRREIEAELSRLRLNDQVTLVGELDAAGVRAELAAASIFCLPSFSEGLPVSIMEAAAIGVPVVSTLIGGIPELIADGVSGATVPAGRADLLADALERMVTTPEFRRKMAAEARVRIEARHNLADSAAQLEQVIAIARSQRGVG